MSYTRNDWCNDFLLSIGNSNPSIYVRGWVIGWTKIESYQPGAMYNLLNTIQWMPNTTPFNSVGVRNYASYADGIQANKQALENGYYPNLLLALRTNLDTQLGNGVNGIVTQSIYKELNTWCGNCNYANTIYSLLFKGQYDTFPGERNIVVNPNIQQAAFDTWQSYIDPKTNAPVPDGTGIFNEWMKRYLSGTVMHPPEGAEFRTVDWHGNFIQVQNFGPDRAEWNLQTSTIEWIKNGF